MFTSFSLSKRFAVTSLAGWRFLFFDSSLVAISNGDVTAIDETLTNPAILRTISVYLASPIRKKIPTDALQKQALQVMADLCTESLQKTVENQ